MRSRHAMKADSKVRSKSLNCVVWFNRIRYSGTEFLNNEMILPLKLLIEKE